MCSDHHNNYNGKFSWYRCVAKICMYINITSIFLVCCDWLKVETSLLVIQVVDFVWKDEVGWYDGSSRLRHHHDTMMFVAVGDGGSVYPQMRTHLQPNLHSCYYALPYGTSQVFSFIAVLCDRYNCKCCVATREGEREKKKEILVKVTSCHLEILYHHYHKVKWEDAVIF